VIKRCPPTADLFKGVIDSEDGSETIVGRPSRGAAVIGAGSGLIPAANWRHGIRPKNADRSS